jgi:predicted proteasome-type protease
MANFLTSLFGRRIGLGTENELMLKGTKVVLGYTGTAVELDVGVTVGSTEADLTNTGIVTFGSTAGAKTYTMTIPPPGQRVMLVCTAGSTANTQAVTLAGSATFDGTNRKVTFVASTAALELVGVTTARGAVAANVGGTLATT